ncbi:2-oxo acid dehydrogenase subunit E2 [Arthrobacter cheniae]|uniref:Dihydrolipoamide acetyltransferase component of pyruvate dehydrogenase complex n=1 Tax=Arthrobacter cheniae TaxID=1258888 RepID=A0A3A5MFE2_9MICC|nr:dihydrolipoamide acetyltransferase family protein [Arthrobacter cheniae]RJT80800.1 2-oxo acid dehydrogenase subunit E2 [Arthrobacter cheniae]
MTTTTSTRIREFRLPDLGEGLTESEIVQWRVAEGETVELNQIIADVETAKAVVELPSPYAGVVVKLHEAAGAVVDVGARIVSFEVAGEPEMDDPTPMSASNEAPEKREPNLVGYGAAVEKGGRPQRRSRTLRADTSMGTPATTVVGPTAGTSAGTPASTPAGPPAAPPAGTSAGTSAGERPRSTPPVRKLARDLGITLDALTGTGPGALITRADVLAALAGTTGSPTATPAAGADPVAAVHVAPVRSSPAGSTLGETRTPIRGMRKHTAAAMVASAFTAPHVTEFLTIDVTETMDLLTELKAARAFDGTRVTPLTIVAKAVCIAISRNSTLNSSWDEASQEIVQYADVNLGIAAATPRGLLVPNIKAAQSLTLVDLARALNSLADTARAGRTPPADLAGGTVSITNIGVFGIDAGTPILNPGEAAILAMGAVRSMPWEYQGAVALRSVMTLSLSFDHRLVDGEQGSRFLADVGTILRKPAMVLTMV